MKLVSIGGKKKKKQEIRLGFVNFIESAKQFSRSQVESFETG